MKNNPFIELVKTFTSEEISRFKKYLKSPYHNNRKIIYSLFKEIADFYPNFDNNKLNKEYLYLKIIKKGKFNDNTMRGLLSMLDKCAYDFLIFENIKKKELSSINILLKEFNYRGVINPFIHLTKNKENLCKGIEGIDTSFLYEKYFLDASRFNFSKLHDKLVNSKGKLKDHLDSFEAMSENLIIYSISTLISDFIPVIIYHYEYEINIKDFISKIFIGSINPWALYNKLKENNPYSFLLKMYLKLLKAFDNIENESSYFEYKKFVFENMNKITKDEFGFHICYLINLCNIKNNRHFNENTLKEEYELNLLTIKNNLFIDDKTQYLPVDLFRSIVLLGIKLRDYNNVELFIRDYYPKLYPSERKNYYNHGLSFLRFAQGKYNESIRHSVKVSVDHYMLKYDMRNLTLKLYYELNEYDKAFDLIHSYKEFLNNNIFTTNEKKNIYSNFIKYYKILISYKSGDVKIDIDYLYDKFKKEKQISDKEWLNDKFENVKINTKSIKSVG